MLFSFLSFLSFFSFVNITKVEGLSSRSTFSVMPGTTVTFMPGTDFEGTSCSGTDSLKVFDVWKDEYGSYKIKFKDNVSIAEGGSESFTCSYESSLNYNDASSKTQIDLGGEITFTFNYGVVGSDYNISYQLVKNTSASWVNFADKNYFVSFGSIVSDAEVKTGGEYINVDCKAGSTDTCIFSLKDDFTADDIKEATATVVFQTEGGVKSTANITLRLNPKITIRANEGEYGTCSFGAGWEAVNGHYEYGYTSGGVTLPSCTPKEENSLLEFYGWVYDPNNLGGNIMSAGTCTSFPSVATNTSFDINSSSSTMYYSCYKYKSGIALDLTNVDVDIQSDWISLGGNKYYISFDGQFALPDAKLKDGVKGTKFAGWRENGGTGTPLAPGTSVSSSGKTYSAVVETTQTVVYQYRHLYVGKTEALSYQGKTISSCSSSSSANLTTNLVGTECQIHAVKETEGDNYTEVFMVVDGETVTIKYKVLATLEGDTEENPEEFIIKFDYGIDGNYSDDTPSSSGGESSGSSTDDKVNSDVSISSNGMCDTYKVSIGTESSPTYFADYRPTQDEAQSVEDESGVSIDYASSIYDVSNPATFWDFYGREENGSYSASDTGVGTRHFQASSTCKDAKLYVAFCLESASPSPSSYSDSTLYVIEKDKSSYTEPLQKAIQYAYKQYLKNEINGVTELTNNRMGTMVALRLIYILEGGYDNAILALNSSKFLSYVQYYKLAMDLKKDPVNGYATSWAWSNEDVKKVAKSIMDEYFRGFTSLKETEETQLEVKDLNKEKIGTNGDNITLKITGTLKLPDDAYETDEKIKKITATVKTHNSLKTSDKVTLKNDKNAKTTEFSFELTYNIKNAKLLKEKGNIVLDLKFETDTTAFSAAILRAKGSTNHQKMLIYDPNADSGASINIYFEGDSTTCDLKDYNKPASEFTDEDVANFKEENCCDLITDVGSELYQVFCQNSCTKNDFSLTCELPTNESANGTAEASNYNVYSMYEAVDYDFKEKYKTCIVDVSKDSSARANTDALTDARGNEISLKEYSGNAYCRVSCKEDWNFATSSFKNFVGVNAVKAGSYFQIDNDLFIGGARTCVTTYIDYDKYQKEVWNLSDKMTTSWNSYAWTSTLYNVLVASGREESLDYYQYEVDSTKGNKYTCYVDVDEDDESALSEISGITCSGGTCVTSGLLDDCEEKTVKSQYNYGDIEDLEWEKYETYSYYEKKSATCYIYSVENSAERVAADSEVRKHEAYALGQSSPTIGSLATTVKASNETKHETGDNKDSGWYTSAPSNGSCAYPESNRITTDDGKISLYKQLAGETEYQSTAISTLISTYTEEVQTARSAIDKKADYMAACQNFYLENVSTSDTNTFNSKKDSKTSNTYLDKEKVYGTGYSYKIDESKDKQISSKDAKYQIIETKFEPDIKYQYEEAEYMTLIGENNYLISNDEKNNEVMGISSDKKDSNEKLNECVDITYLKDNYGQTMQLCKNKINTYSYKYSVNDGKDIYASDSGVTNTDSNSGNIGNNVTEKTIEICQIDSSKDYSYSPNDTTSKTTCAKAALYYYEVNYVKQTLKNSSFYKNYGNWYVNNVTDVKVHAENLNDAIKKGGSIKSSGKTEAYWSPMAAYNVFPIKITTRRNLYRYLYSFDNIGYFSEKITYTNPTTNKTETRDLGRVMGTDVSIILNHNHTCFYEVYEDVCKCCGDPISTVTVEPYGVVTDEVTKDYCAQNGCADSIDDSASGDGTFGFYNSSVSLYDLDAVSDSDASKNLAQNWNKDEQFYYEGDNYTTSKGYGLADQIQERGESIYDSAPEYSYYLDPAALAEIRDYNEIYDYKVSDSRLRPVDTHAMSSDTTNFAVQDKDTTVTVGHYASKFLEEQMDAFITDDYRSNVLTKKSKVCQVVVESSDDASVSRAAKDAYELVKNSDCRWVDYVQKYDDKYIRLAFK